RLNVKALRDLTPQDLETVRTSLAPDDFQKALYVLEENQRVITFSEAIVNGDLKALGKLLIESHEGLSKQYRVSCVELDFLVDCIRDNPDVLGGRMMGGGFGGCTINLVRKESVAVLKQNIQSRFTLRFDRECTFYEVKLSAGTHLIN
ncbi:MAG: galactokinase, partial [Bacteroidota bacterium]